MLHFDCDYMEGACPEIAARLAATNLEQTPGYGTDDYCRSARERIRQACGTPEAAVHFLVGGTQTNATVIDALLRRHEGAVCADTGHINVHEAGAIEATGHKVLALPGRDGKLPAAGLKACLEAYDADDTREHMVAPGLVYISQPTELGTLYSLKELEELSVLCRGAGIPLYVDGARLGYALAARENDVTLPDLARLADVFYIGGTKVGALFGEAVVAREPGRLPHFFSLAKQHGAVLAKGRLLGLQFDTLFTDGLYVRLGRHAVDLAQRLREGFAACGFAPAVPSPTNQQFFRLPAAVVDALARHASFEYWGPRGEKESVVRFVTSWATRPEAVDSLLALVREAGRTLLP